MRINVYREEIPAVPEVELVSTSPRPGKRYYGLRVLLISPPELHHRAGDDDRSAVTFWLGSIAQAQEFARALGRDDLFVEESH